MNLKAIAALGIVGLALLAFIWSQQQTIKAERQLAASAQASVAQHAAALKKLTVDAERSQQDSAKLTVALQQVQDQLITRHAQWEALKRENKELKSWADTDLPAGVVRVRERPAITGAHHYQKWLQQSDRVHPAAKPAAQK